MVGTDEHRQYLIARESGKWLAEAERIQAEFDDLDPAGEEISDVLNDKLWLDARRLRNDRRLLARRRDRIGLTGGDAPPAVSPAPA
jgi:hypothetical protein